MGESEDNNEEKGKAEATSKHGVILSQSCAIIAVIAFPLSVSLGLISLPVGERTEPLCWGKNCHSRKVEAGEMKVR